MTVPTVPTGPTDTPRTRTARTRVSFLRLAVVLVCTLAVVWVGVRSVSALVTSPASPRPSAFAAYVDVTVTPTYPFETPDGPAQSNVVLAFVVAGQDAPCTPMWGGAYTLDDASSQLQLDRRVSQLRLTGGDVRASFGGQAGTELATACTDTDALAKAYSSVIDRYDLRTIDLDIEGATLADAATTSRRAAAIKQVQDDAKADGHEVAVWLTLPVATSGLTADGKAQVTQMLAAGVDLAGVNGMTMDFGTLQPGDSMSAAVLDAATALHTQVRSAYSAAGTPISDTRAWAKVGLTPMIGQNDVVNEQFTLADATTLNEFAREHGVGLLSMWSLNRDATCTSPLPSVLSVVQTSCSGVEQSGKSFAEVLADELPAVVASPGPEPSGSATDATPPGTEIVDDPAHSPFPIWDPLGTYPAGTKIVWRQQVYQARYWTSGFAPDTPVVVETDSPWTLIGPVMPGDTPAPLPTLPEGSYPQWDPAETYVAGTRVQLGLVPYEAKWWSQGQEPGVPVAGGSPWVLITPSS
ncbi:exported chitinase [Actinomycetota bacterium]|nr:exported chitinase [Actinomycetota bacterium]